LSQVTAFKNILDINGGTKVFAVIGDPVEHSSSPGLWNRAFCDLSYNAVYVAMRVRINHLKTALLGLRAANVAGINLTMPHKIEAVKYCTQLHSPADSLGSINTLWFKQDGMHGYNTDATGFLRLLKNCSKAGSCKKALVLGAGGAARAVIWAFSKVIGAIIISKPKTISDLFLIKPEILILFLPFLINRFLFFIT
jgi:shikimate dehydrogenase